MTENPNPFEGKESEGRPSFELKTYIVETMGERIRYKWDGITWIEESRSPSEPPPLDANGSPSDAL